MKQPILLLLLLLCLTGKSQSRRNIFIITTDGFRWQEVFNGADPVLLHDTSLVKDTLLMQQLYGSDNTESRRKKLLPFFWNVIAAQGCLAGNRNYGNEVNVSNLYKISYPGYSEILTGYADRTFVPNLPVMNHHENILAYMNSIEGYAGKVAAFSSWDVMPFIINEKQSRIPVNSGYEMLEETGDTLDNLINEVQKSIQHKNSTRHDLLTYASAKNYIEQQHPKIVFIGLGETDEYAHKAMYDQYLQKAHSVDQMIAELWYYVQTDPFYKNNTTFIITTDHGRGSKTSAWDKHGFWIKGSGQVWSAMIGPDIVPAGELKERGRAYQKQIAATISAMAGEKFVAAHPVAPPLQLPVLPVAHTFASLANIMLDK